MAEYKTIKKGEYPKNTKYKLIGNLDTLYHNLGTLEENRYTDAHTESMDIRVGTVYSIPEEEVDINSRNDCSNGLHVGSKEYGFSGSGLGDTMVLCLVNPAKIRSVPLGTTHKMRVSEMFIACIIEDKEMHDPTDILHFDEEYHAYTIEELEVILKYKTFEKLKCQKQNIVIIETEVTDIVELMSSRVVNV